MKTLSRRNFVKPAALSAAVVSCPPLARAAKTAGKPNIIFILTDDMGWGDPKCFGHPFMKTPNTDRLARVGTIFTQFFVNPDGSGAELYDIPADSEERTNLAKKHPDTAMRLREKLMDWKKTLPK